MIRGTQVGAYRVLQQIGAGGMGSVWLAEHVMLGRRAALKVLHPSFSSRQDIVTRFFNEARAATAISDPGIVQIFDFGHHSDGSAYIVMELLDGETLAARRASTGRLAVGDAVRIMRQVAGSLGAAHARGIVHRDLKPENIFLVRDPEVPGGERAKILDFGIAKLIGDPSVQTQTSTMMGTPLYMSPEQCRGAGLVDHRSDVYALGCVLFTLIAGGPPFFAEGSGELIAMHLREPAPRVSTRAEGVPPAVDDLIARCLEKDPDRRYASGTELAAALGALGALVALVDRGSSEGQSPRPAGRVAVVAPTVASTTLSTSAGSAIRPPTVTHRSRGKLVAALAGVVVLGGIGTFIAVRGSLSGAQQPASSAAPSPAPAAPAPTPAPAPPDPSAALALRMKDALAHFVAWSRAHPGAPCPDAAAIGMTVDDPWGHPIRLTCTEQPANQVVGAISAGPDGRMGTEDDLASWQLGRDVYELVRGARWVAAEAPTQGVRVVKPRSPKSTAGAATPKPVGPADAKATKPTAPAAPKPKSPAKAAEFDENGLPTAR